MTILLKISVIFRSSVCCTTFELVFRALLIDRWTTLDILGPTMTELLPTNYAKRVGFFMCKAVRADLHEYYDLYEESPILFDLFQ